MSSALKLLFIFSLFGFLLEACSALDSKAHLVKITTTIMIENDGNTPITHHLIDCDERNGHSRLSNIVAKLSNLSVPVTKTEDSKWWRIDLSESPIEPGKSTPLMVTKVYTHLELVPAHDVYLMPYSSIQYQVRIIKQGRPQKIKVPSEQYYLVVDDRELVELDESSSTVLALESEGSTKIRFIDKSVISDEDFIQPESNIHIVSPSYLTMHITPGDSWALQKFTDYTVEIRIFDSHQHQIYPSDNIDIQLTSSNELVITNSTTNGTYHTIHTLNSGPSKLVARLQPNNIPYSFDRTSQEIELIQELNIYEPLDVKPTAIVLPWLPESKPSYQVSIYAAGGTGSYHWSSNNTALTEVNYNEDDSSVATITTNGEGTAFIQCTDTKSSVFLRHSLIVVTRIVELNVLPTITETELGGSILLPVAVYGNVSSLLKGDNSNDGGVESGGLVVFDDCSKIKFEVDIVEKTRFIYDEVVPNTRPKSCASLKFSCTQPGSSRIWISYSDPTDPLSKPIKTTTIIACYKPLRLVYPSEVGVLALHTSVQLAFEGGPRPFGSRTDDHYSYLEPTKDPIITFEPIIDRYRHNKDLHVFRARCNEYGETSVTLNVGNQPSATLPNPASSKTTMKIICAKPDSIQLRPRLKESCPLNEMAMAGMVVPISTTVPTDIELVVFDDARRQFLNISSFSIKFTLSGQRTSSANLRPTEEVNAVAGFERITRNYITVHPNGQEGPGKIQAHLNHYRNQGLYKGQTLDLTANLDIQFVDYAIINPNRTILYNHKKNVVVLTILKGSGYFSIESLQGTKHANVSYVSVFGQHRINIVPLSVGKFAIRLEDQCIETSLGVPVLSEVSIVSDFDFSREVLKPGNSMRYCKDVDESMFCVYLSVDKIKTITTSSTTTRTPPPPPPPPPSPRTTSAPAIVEQRQHQVQPSTTTTKPILTITQQAPSKVSFDEPATNSETKGESLPTSILQRIMGYLILTIVTASALTFGYKWWQDQIMRRPPIQSETSFLRQTPSHHGSMVRFSPSTSTSSKGPSSSTPKARPLYTERFSTTLFSD